MNHNKLLVMYRALVDSRAARENFIREPLQFCALFGVHLPPTARFPCSDVDGLEASLRTIEKTHARHLTLRTETIRDLTSAVEARPPDCQFISDPWGSFIICI